MHGKIKFQPFTFTLVALFEDAHFAEVDIVDYEPLSALLLMPSDCNLDSGTKYARRTMK